MKKLLKYTGIFLGTIFLLVTIFALFVQLRGIPTYQVEKIDHTVHKTPQNIARGKKLMQILCANCHQNPETGKLTGKLLMDAPAEFGKIYSQNITQDERYGIGNWTEGELLLLLRTGIGKDGRYMPPYMAKLPNMSNEDVDAIIAFLKSDDAMVAADPTPDRPVEPSFLTKLLCLVVFKPFEMPDTPIPAPDTTNAVAWGKYLAHNLDCFTCHSADFKTLDFLTPEKSEGYFGGGNKPLNLKGQVVLTSNLTPDMETGIGAWTEEEFISALRSGLKQGEPALQYPMVPYIQLSEKEAGAIFRYLQTIPLIQNKIERTVYD